LTSLSKRLVTTGEVGKSFLYEHLLSVEREGNTLLPTYGSITHFGGEKPTLTSKGRETTAREKKKGEDPAYNHITCTEEDFPSLGEKRISLHIVRREC